MLGAHAAARPRLFILTPTWSIYVTSRTRSSARRPPSVPIGNKNQPRSTLDRSRGYLFARSVAQLRPKVTTRHGLSQARLAGHPSTVELLLTELPPPRLTSDICRKPEVASNLSTMYASGTEAPRQVQGHVEPRNRSAGDCATHISVPSTLRSLECQLRDRIRT